MRNETPTVFGSTAVGHALEVELARLREQAGSAPRVVDVGGGSGVWAVPLAAQGCLVTVVEPNPNAIATLQRRAEEEAVLDRITVVATDSDSLTSEVPARSADLVLAHGLLEVVEDPQVAVAALAETVSTPGTMSVLVSNKHAAVLHRALAGRFDEARRLHDAPDGVLDEDGDAVVRRFDVEQLRALHAWAELDIVLCQGEGIVSDSVQGAGDTDLAAFEFAAAATPPLRDVASRLHVLAKRAAPGSLRSA